MTPSIIQLQIQFFSCYCSLELKGFYLNSFLFVNMQRKNIYYSFIFVFVYLHIYKLIIDWNISLISSGFIIISKHNFCRFSTSHHCIKVTLTHNQWFYLKIYVPVFINSYYELLIFLTKKTWCLINNFKTVLFYFAGFCSFNKKNQKTSI